VSDHHRLVRPLDAGTPAPVWPAGVSLPGFALRDIPAIHGLLERAYARGGGSVPGLDLWWPTVAADSEFDPELCIIAKDADGAIVGFALVWSSAFIKDLVVDPSWHRRGLGTAMLHEIFRRLAARRHPSVALKVMVDNPSGAERLYRNLGFVDG
jgi:ribosomal protein S18 acetylase RimI-like enzyme